VVTELPASPDGASGTSPFQSVIRRVRLIRRTSFDSDLQDYLDSEVIALSNKADCRGVGQATLFSPNATFLDSELRLCGYSFYLCCTGGESLSVSIGFSTAPMGAGGGWLRETATGNG
jgi:hypothetical protein